MNEFKHRPCGTCSACCSLAMANKPTGIACQHVVPGTGCSIYEDRPPTCVRFQCPWSVGILPTRPDQLGAVIFCRCDNQDDTDGWLDGVAIVVVLAPGVTFNTEVRGEVRLLADWLTRRLGPRDYRVDVFTHFAAARPTGGIGGQ